MVDMIGQQARLPIRQVHGEEIGPVAFLPGIGNLTGCWALTVFVRWSCFPAQFSGLAKAYPGY